MTPHVIPAQRRYIVRTDGRVDGLWFPRLPLSGLPIHPEVQILWESENCIRECQDAKNDRLTLYLLSWRCSCDSTTM